MALLFHDGEASDISNAELIRKIFSIHGLLIILRLLWIVLNNLYAFPAYFFFIFLALPLKFLHLPLWYTVEETLYRWMLDMVACWSYTGGYNVIESGFDLNSILDDCFVFLPNHQSTADVPLCMFLFAARKRATNHLMWIMDSLFKYSNFGWVSCLHQDFFITAGKDNRELSLARLRSHLRDVFVPLKRRYIVLYPEGGLLRKRIESSRRFAKKIGLDVDLQYCALPRTGAFHAIVDEIGPRSQHPRINRIVDATIGYPENRPLNIQTLVSAKRSPCFTHVHYRVFDINEIPGDKAELDMWLYRLYSEKNELLKRFHATGHFTSASDERVLKHAPLKYLALHLLFFFTTLGLVLFFRAFFYSEEE